MAPSQLKTLKSSLREQGIVGPQKSKKQKLQARKSGALSDSRVGKNAALQNIRDQSNPFEVTAPPRSKYEFASAKATGGAAGDGIVSRPGVRKGLGEENRRKTLLSEMQRRKKVGGIMDRRFGENDPKMAPEEKALERFVKEQQRGSKKGSMFDLEDDDGDMELTHLGESLSHGHTLEQDDYTEVHGDVPDEEDSGDLSSERPGKRRKLSGVDGFEETSPTKTETPQAERPKTKKEVMEEVIAKSKLHKYERQQAKEDDDGLRAELDKGLPDLFALMHRKEQPAQAVGNMNPDRRALLEGTERTQADKEYDERLRQMALDQRAKPTARTLTDEEKVQQEAQRLKDLEEKRLRRMQGHPDDEAMDVEEEFDLVDADEDMSRPDSFGLGSGLLGIDPQKTLGVEDEDEFLIEDDLLASGEEEELSEVESNGMSENSEDDDDDREFVQGLLSKEDAGRDGLTISVGKTGETTEDDPGGTLAYSYSCPGNHQEFLKLTESIDVGNLPTVVQRIRALYHPQLASENKFKLADFASVLVEHISYLANQPQHPPLETLEQLIRHIHSLAKSFPEKVGSAFRSHLKALHEERFTSPTPGDLIILTAISSTFPTSDHFHQVVTPAMLCMGRYLSQKIPTSLSELATGTYIVTLCLQYQRLSKRYVPEAVTYVLNALSALAPIKTKTRAKVTPCHIFPESIRLRGSLDVSGDEVLRFWDITPGSHATNASNNRLKVALINTQFSLLQSMQELWADKPALCEIFDPVLIVLRSLKVAMKTIKIDTKVNDRIRTTINNVLSQLRQSLASRKPLRLHNHRPLAIKTSIPKFEESYNPYKHYDPDRDRAESAKLKAEHKRERKGALRELRKDANFVARENLKEKKERDSAYEKKYKRLINEIQGEEGREAKNYEREKSMRKSKR